ncbi:MAG: glutaminyl-peptide cyclotransferase, partial [Halanaerobiales bacterium]
MKKYYLILILIIILSFPALVFANQNNELQEYTYEVINTYPHDKDAFTQGLYYKDGIIYEGTGLNGKSDLRKYNLDTGQIINKNELAYQYFGEGITLLNNKVYQSTWKAKTMFIYDKNIDLLEITKFPFQCWGLTDDNQYLIMSDGSNKIRYLNPKNYEVIKTIEVTLEGKPIDNINELEYIDDKIYANIWQEDIIVIIDPDSGKVSGLINLENIIDPENYQHELNVLNGIAYDEKNDKLFVTGKLWPKIFEIELLP